MFFKPPFAVGTGTGPLDTTTPATPASPFISGLPAIWLDAGLRPPSSAISDDFGSTTLSPVWTFDSNDINSGGPNSGTYSLTANPGSIRLGNGVVNGYNNDGHLDSLIRYDIRGSYVYARVNPSPAPTTVGGSYECGLRVYYGSPDRADPNFYKNYVCIELDRGQGAADTFSMVVCDNGNFNILSTATTYNATNHAWWRIRENNGTIYYDGAPTTASNPPIESDWVNIQTATVNGNVVSGTLSDVCVGFYYRLTGTVGTIGECYVDIDSYNAAASAAQVVNLNNTLAGATGQVGNVTVLDTVTLTTVASAGQTGSPTVGVVASPTGTPATGLVGSVLANPAVAAGKSHTDLFIRQFLEDYYTREWNKPELKKPEEAEQPKRRKARAARRAVEQDPYLLAEPAVMRLAADTAALHASLASLKHSFTVQSQPSESDEDEDLLLLSSVL